MTKEFHAGVHTHTIADQEREQATRATRGPARGEAGPGAECSHGTEGRGGYETAGRIYDRVINLCVSVP